MQKQLTVVFLALLQLTCSFDLATYQQQYQTQVGAPYKSAVTVVATDIIEYLAISPVPTTAEDGRQIVANLNAKAQSFSANLATASQASDALRQQLDKEVEALVAQGSAVEQQIAANELQLQQTIMQIQQTIAQLDIAQNVVNAAQGSVQHAEAVLHDEEEKVEKARRCLGGCRFWLCKKACGVINGGGIDRAKDDRGRAQAEVAACQQRLAELQAQQAQLTQQQAAFQQTKANFEATKANLNAQLAQLNQARDNVVIVDTGLKALIFQVSTLLGKSQVLADVIKSLIDMEAIIKPLTAIADQVISYTTNADDIAYLNTMKQKISASLPLVQQKLPQYALIPPAA
jgi:predicted  nucleic acid-binding Zn-ribbon protein